MSPHRYRHLRAFSLAPSRGTAPPRIPDVTSAGQTTYVLAVFERIREIGMLRAVGMTRRQVREMVRQEGVLTALLGAALALPSESASQLPSSARSTPTPSVSRSTLPVRTLRGALAGVTVFVGVAAAAFAARRASRLKVLEALQYE